MYELGNQYGILFDLNYERFGYNKREDETYIKYLNRLKMSDVTVKTHDMAIPEFPPGVYQ